jgi:AraC-like DNA-binding protein
MELLDELRALIVRHADAGIRRGILDGVGIAAIGHTTDPAANVTEPSLTIVAQGTKRTMLGTTNYDYTEGQYVVTSVALPVTGFVLKASEELPFVVISIALRPAAIAGLLLELDSVARPTGFSGLVVSDAPAELLDPVVRLVRLLDQPADVVPLAPGIEREILWRLLTGEQGAIVRQIGLADGSLAQVSRAIRWLREHYAEPVLVDDLAGTAGMSAATFHRHFKSATSMTPIQFQKQLRLSEARRLLLAAPGDVADVGYSVGYGSPSQFSREYRRRFGRPPALDADALRATGGLAPSLP